MAIIYLCENKVTHKKYIGITIRSLNERKWEHLKELNSGKKGGTWQYEYNQYGKDSFQFSILQEVHDLETLYNIENHYINKYNCLDPLGYNKKLNGTTNYTVKDHLDNSKLSLIDIKGLLLDILAINPYYSIGELAAKYNLTIDSVQDIIRCKSYKWFALFFPEEYTLLEEIHSSGLERKSFLLKPIIFQALCSYLDKDNYTTDSTIASSTGLSVSSIRDLFRGKAFTWAKTEFPEVYTLVRNKYQEKNKKPSIVIVDKLTNVTHTFSSLADAASSINIDRRRIAELISGKRKILQDRYVA